MKHCVTIALSAALFASTSYAQSSSEPPIVRIDRQVFDLKNELALAESKIDALEENVLYNQKLLKTISSQLQVQSYMLSASNTDTIPAIQKSAKQNAVQKEKDLATSSEKFAQTKDKLGPDLANNIQSCITVIKNINTDIANSKQANESFDDLLAASKCPREKWEATRRMLSERSNDLTKKWEQCHNQIRITGNQPPESWQQAISARNNGGWAEYQCSDILDEGQALLDGEAAFSDALAFAAQICASSGGNPYVCGALFALAILMDMFGSGDGDGTGQDGDGQSSVKIPGSAGQIPNAPPAPPPPPFSVKGTAGGTINCVFSNNFNRKIWQCHNPKWGKPRQAIDPGNRPKSGEVRELFDIIKSGDASGNKLGFCTNKKEILGIWWATNKGYTVHAKIIKKIDANAGNITDVGKTSVACDF